jgi:Family of unknown function (DUF5990)
MEDDPRAARPPTPDPDAPDTLPQTLAHRLCLHEAARTLGSDGEDAVSLEGCASISFRCPLHAAGPRGGVGAGFPTPPAVSRFLAFGGLGLEARLLVDRRGDLVHVHVIRLVSDRGDALLIIRLRVHDARDRLRERSGAPGFRGPAVNGPPNERFIYLTWIGRQGRAKPAMFRRAKLRLDAVPASALATALRTGVLVGRLRLIAQDGMPVCGSVRPPKISWSEGPGPRARSSL